MYGSNLLIAACNMAMLSVPPPPAAELPPPKKSAGFVFRLSLNVISFLLLSIHATRNNARRDHTSCPCRVSLPRQSLP